MNENKENINRVKKMTRIPLPVDPLPPVPKRLILDHMKNIDFPRIPLKTLNTQAGPSNTLARYNSAETPIKVDNRFVTKRSECEDKLDWELKVFKDITVDDIINVVDSDDDEKECIKNKQNRVLDLNSQKDSPLYRPPRDKNIKRSLKRPHSRKLLFLSPVKDRVVLDDGAIVNISSRYFCRTDETQEKFTQDYTKYVVETYSVDIFKHLIKIESRSAKSMKISTITRACVINWLMKVNGPFGDPSILQTACWYFDEILENMTVPVEKLQLAATACYWIAQKLFRPGYPAARLVKYADNAFPVSNLAHAERTALKALKFPPQPVVIHDFVSYFVWVCGSIFSGEIEIGATFICMSALIFRSEQCIDYPSVTAAAAVYNTLICLNKRPLLTALESDTVYKAAISKASNFQGICSAQRIAVRAVSSPKYEYRTPFEHFGQAPYFIAQRVVDYANNLAITDAVISGTNKCSF